MQSKISLTVAIPAFNEERNVEEAINNANKEAIKITQDYEILVIDDGSTDSTPEILQNLQKKFKNLKIITHATNQGIEPSIKDLYNFSQKKLIFLNSADNEISMSILSNLFNKMIEREADIVVAKRKVKEYNLKRKIISWGYNFLPKLLFGVDTFDAGCAKLVKSQVYKNLDIKSESVFAEAERLIKAYKLGYKIENIFVEHQPKKERSSVKIQHVFSSLQDMFKLFLRAS